MINKYPAYRIPDASSGWLLSSPVAHNRYVRDIEAQLNRKLKPMVQLVKAWKYYQNLPIKSFYLELFTAYYFRQRRRINFSTDLCKIALRYNDLAYFDDPMEIVLSIEVNNTLNQRDTALLKLTTAASRAIKAVDATKRGNDAEAFIYWKKLFNNEFPSR